MKEKFLIEAMLILAMKVAEASSCDRAKHGCVLTDLDLQVMSYGYNGPPRGVPNECLRPQEPGKCGCVHAESNAVAKAGQWDNMKIAFITGYPCELCAGLLLNSNVVCVITAQEAHRDYPEGEEQLERAGIKLYNYQDLPRPEVLHEIVRHKKYRRTRRG